MSENSDSENSSNEDQHSDHEKDSTPNTFYPYPLLCRPYVTKTLWITIDTKSHYSYLFYSSKVPQLQNSSAFISLKHILFESKSLSFKIAG